MLVYVHVPFCRNRCNYCAFYSQALGPNTSPASSPLMREYVDTLLLELARAADEHGDQTIHSVFFGGGTPSLLPAPVMSVIMDRLHRHFKMSDKAEITLEANPESLRKRNIFQDYLAAGINRLAIGVQSLDDTILHSLGRSHKAIDAINAIGNARDAGFANIGIDLMWGLPGQSMRQWLQTLKEAVALGPDHISSYGLALEPGTLMAQNVESGIWTLPPERDQSIMFMEGASLLEGKGYLHYEISNFAKMGYQCRHNMGYWEGMPYLGLGPSATSTIGDRRWTNPADFSLWKDTIASGQPEIEYLTPKTRVLELIMLRLRTARGLRMKAYKDMTGREFLKDHQKFIQALHENGLVRIRDGYLRLTRSGMLVSNAIVSNLFERVNNMLDEDLSSAVAVEPEEIPALEVQPLSLPKVN